MHSKPGLIPAVVGGIAAPIVIIALAVLPFLNPVWVRFEEGRSDVTAWTGLTSSQVDQATGSILSDLVFGPPNFNVQVDGRQILDPREVSHMQDVRGVFMMLGLLALLALVLLVLAFAAGRGRRLFWRGLELGATVLVGGVIVVGAFFALFFDQAFLLFHDIFFAPGTFAFDPRDEKLVQLFPDQFWNETSIALGVAILVLALGLRILARWRQREMADMPSVAAASLPATQAGR